MSLHQTRVGEDARVSRDPAFLHAFRAHFPSLLRHLQARVLFVRDRFAEDDIVRHLVEVFEDEFQLLARLGDDDFAVIFHLSRRRGDPDFRNRFRPRGERGDGEGGQGRKRGGGGGG